ncbi:MAG: serine hydrolase [Herbinix sp.]|jgi:CubicO group peptidase (beta-lactamase class C family)|nr:serine hydrolase [Herbinix sp.]
MLRDFVTMVQENHMQVYGIVVIQNGEKVAEHHFVLEERRNLYSATKSITSTAVGMAIEEGYFRLEDSILPYLEKELVGEVSQEQLDHLSKITVERLLTMSILDYPFERLTCDHWLKHILSIPLPNIDRRKFHYNNFTSYLAGVIVENTTGMPMLDFLKPRLFDPLHIPQVTCAYSPEGHFYGSTGMMLTVNELSRIGQLYLQMGSYEGKELISEQWVRKATAKQIENREGGYGYYFWRQEHNSYRASGKWGQICAVLPDKNAVITILSNLEEEKLSDMMHQGVWDTIVPKLS